MATFFSWTSSYATGIASIDAQHKQLVDMIDLLFTAIQNGNGDEVVDGLMDELIDYSTNHFATEEALFDEYGYPGAKAHKKLHAALKTQLSKLRQDLTLGREQMTARVGYFLIDWLKNHILQTDRKFAPFLISRGVN
jgi:hemerythrin-like metal-binding protein